jgi:molybdenum cofactor biosynthesis enzyme MoaA
MRRIPDHDGAALAGDAHALRDAGLMRVTISLDALDEEVFSDKQ